MTRIIIGILILLFLFITAIMWCCCNIAGKADEIMNIKEKKGDI